MKWSLMSLLGACLVIASSVTVSADTIVVGFEGLGNGSPVPNGYQGLNWSNFYSLNGVTYGVPGNGYTVGVVSPPMVGYNAFGAQASILGAGAFDPFNLESATITAAWRNNLQVLVEGFLNGNLIYSQLLNVSIAQQVVNFNFNNVDEVRFTSSGGVNPGLGGDGTHFAIDNIRISNPEPATMLAWGLIAGVGAVGYRLRKRKAAAVA